MHLSYFLEIGLIIANQTLPFLAGLWRWKMLDRASRIIVLLAGAGVLSEVLAMVATILFRNNLAVYNVVSLVYVLLNIRYFSYGIRQLAAWRLDLVLYLLSTGIWIYCNVPRLFESHNLFVNYEGVLSISLALWLLLRLTGSERAFKNPHFWFAMLLLISYILNTVQWNLYNYFIHRYPEDMPLVNRSITVLSVLFNIGYALVFYYYPRLQYTADPDPELRS